MQILRTEVFRTIPSSGEPVLRVTFCGEGAECVTVDMTSAGHEADADDCAIRKAAAILVQTASCALAVNDYDAQSNGNCDELSVVAANDEKSEVYIFEYRDGEGTRRVPPSRMSNFEAAREEAIRCAVDLLVDLDPGKDALSGWLIRVYSETGELLFSVDVAQAEAARQASQSC